MQTSKRKTRTVIVNPVRFVIASVITLIILSIVFTYITGSMRSEASTPVRTIDVTVEAGDTLWSIARAHNVNQEDIRAVVWRIRTFNDLPNANIYPNQVIKIPIK